MKKQQFLSFINKYHLGGLINSVKLKCEDGKLSCQFVSPDSTNVGYIESPGFDEFTDFNICIYNTNELLKLLGIMDDVIRVKFDKDDSGNFNMLNILDKKKKKVKFVLANLNAIDDAPELNELPKFETQIILNEDLINTFSKAHGALSDSGKLKFAIKNIKGKLFFIVNYKGEKHNDNNVTFEVASNSNGIDTGDLLVFDGDFLKSVFIANKSSQNGVLDVSNSGFARVSYNNDNFNGDYYLIGMDD